MRPPELEDGSTCMQAHVAERGGWLRVFRWVGIVLCNTRDQSRIDQRLQVGGQRLGSRLRVDLMTRDVKSADTSLSSQDPRWFSWSIRRVGNAQRLPALGFSDVAANASNWQVSVA